MQVKDHLKNSISSSLQSSMGNEDQKKELLRRCLVMMTPTTTQISTPDSDLEETAMNSHRLKLSIRIHFHDLLLLLDYPMLIHLHRVYI